MVRAKFVCSFMDGSVIYLNPVYSGSDENKAFWVATPGGQITLNCANDDARAKFEVGKEYYVDFTPAG